MSTLRFVLKDDPDFVTPFPVCGSSAKKASSYKNFNLGSKCFLTICRSDFFIFALAVVEEGIVIRSVCMSAYYVIK